MIPSNPQSLKSFKRWKIERDHEGVASIGSLPLRVASLRSLFLKQVEVFVTSLEKWIRVQLVQKGVRKVGTTVDN